MRSPFARLSAIASRIILTASSASLATSCGNCAARRSISSDLVIAFASPSTVALCRVELRFEQRSEVRRAGLCARILVGYPLHRFAFVGVFFRFDRQVDAAVFAVD